MFPIFYKRRILRAILRSLRQTPEYWHCTASDHAKSERMHVDLYVPFRWEDVPTITVHNDDLTVPLLWRGRLRRAVRRAAWVNATKKMFPCS